MFGSPLATSEGRIDFITNVRAAWYIYTGKTGDIDVRHFERFLRGLEFKFGRELSIEILDLPTPFIMISVRVPDSSCLVGQSGIICGNPNISGAKTSCILGTRFTVRKRNGGLFQELFQGDPMTSVQIVRRAELEVLARKKKTCNRSVQSPQPGFHISGST